MSSTTTTRRINAPIEDVFDTIAHIENFSKAIPDIRDVTFLTDEHEGIGTRFRETRHMGRRDATTELEVTEYVDNDHVRFVADEGGTTWDTVFRLTSRTDGTELTMTMDARPHSLMARLTTPLSAGMVRKAVEKDMDAVKSYCEKSARDDT